MVYKIRTLAYLTILIAGFFAMWNAALAQTGGEFDLTWSSIDSGGGVSSAGEFALSGSIGQHDAGSTLTAGEFELTGGIMSGFTLMSTICGDQNDDRSVNILDVVISLQIAVGLIEPTPKQLRLGDLDTDGDVDVADAMIGLQHIVGLVQSLDECGAAPSK